MVPGPRLGITALDERLMKTEEGGQPQGMLSPKLVPPPAFVAVRVVSCKRAAAVNRILWRNTISKGLWPEYMGRCLH